MGWIKDKEACKLWAGPDVGFPLALQRLKQDLACSTDNTFAMESSGGEFLGLGQLLAKENNRIHLARIIIAPHQRGKGLGDLLCRLLIDEGLNRFGQVYFTLNVYSDNANALKLYRRLGFTPLPAPSDATSDKQIVRMVLRPDLTATH